MTLKYNYVVWSIEESKDVDELLLDELQSTLLVHEQKMNHSSTSEDQALKSSTFTFSNSRGRGRGRGSRGRGDRGIDIDAESLGSMMTTTKAEE